jgi:hypothetical protein
VVGDVVGDEELVGAEESADDDAGVDIPEVKTVAICGETERWFVTEFVPNAGLLEAVKQTREFRIRKKAWRVLKDAHCEQKSECLAMDTEPVESPEFHFCINAKPHDLRACPYLHRLGDTIKVGVHVIRLRTLIQNEGFSRLLSAPHHPPSMCRWSAGSKVARPSEDKADHDVAACRFLHIDPNTVVVGRERARYQVSELVHNPALTHLLEHPEHFGRWCTNVKPHDAALCRFVHLLPRCGVVGRRQKANAPPKLARVLGRKILTQEEIPQTILEQQSEQRAALDEGCVQQVAVGSQASEALVRELPPTLNADSLQQTPRFHVLLIALGILLALAWSFVWSGL